MPVLTDCIKYTKNEVDMEDEYVQKLRQYKQFVSLGLDIFGDYNFLNPRHVGTVKQEELKLHNEMALSQKVVDGVKLSNCMKQ